MHNQPIIQLMIPNSYTNKATYHSDLILIY